jgi:hypothetical protein
MMETNVQGDISLARIGLRSDPQEQEAVQVGTTHREGFIVVIQAESGNLRSIWAGNDGGGPRPFLTREMASVTCQKHLRDNQTDYAEVRQTPSGTVLETWTRRPENRLRYDCRVIVPNS